MRHWLRASFIVALFIVFAFSMVSSGQRIELTIATGGAGGPYHVIGTGLGEIWTKAIPGVNATVTSTTASAVNVRNIHTGRADVAFSMSDVCYYAMRGEAPFDAPLGNLVGMASIHTNFCQLITLANSGIRTVADLRGKRVGVGAPGSGTELNARHVLAAAGMTYKDLAKADYLSYAETCEQLANRNIDAGFLTGGLPIGAIEELANKHAIAIIPIEKSLVEILQKDFPVYISKPLPSGTYKGVTASVPTLALKNYLVVNKNLPNDLVYNLTKTMFDNLPALVKYHAAAAEFSLKDALEGMVLPLHPGAKRFYDERGVK